MSEMWRCETNVFVGSVRRKVTKSPSTREPPQEPGSRALQPTPRFVDIKPARHALKRLEKEFVEIWYFTAEVSIGRRP